MLSLLCKVHLHLFTAAWIKWGNILLSMGWLLSTLCVKRILPFSLSACLLGTLFCAIFFFLYLGGIDSALECSSAHETPSFLTAGAWATAMRSSCLHVGFGVLPVLFTTSTVWSLCLLHLPCHDSFSLVFLSFVHEGFWIGDNCSSILDITAGCQRCWLLGVGPGSSCSPILLLLWLCCRTWERYRVGNAIIIQNTFIL